MGKWGLEMIHSNVNYAFVTFLLKKTKQNLWFLNLIQVVPPDQARRLYKALKEKGLPVALIEYEGEQHGFKKVLL